MRGNLSRRRRRCRGWWRRYGFFRVARVADASRTGIWRMIPAATAEDHAPVALATVHAGWWSALAADAATTLGRYGRSPRVARPVREAGRPAAAVVGAARADPSVASCGLSDG
ncbi:hypothetical protein GCM10009661_72910 [Catellatospora chokoriensis]|uniref:Uncharacterized protein n=1 Tax=Catellatospora chokoriensis TaxID=310353 RepID=A0A8J3JWG8_9ACTN|nr:hypothetical protein Cch02nite_57900 [Catellatospora chokoriensis]